jgi:hypothetical protein
MANTQVYNMEGDTELQTNTGLGNKVIHLLEDIKTSAYEMRGSSPTGRQLNKSVKVFHSLTLYLLLHSS